MKRKSHRGLLSTQEIRRWHANVARGSLVTGDMYLRRLGAFCNENGLTPFELAGKGEQELYELLLDYVSAKEEKYAGSYIESTVKAVKSWLIHNDIQITRKIKIKGSDDTPSLREERVPSPPELKSIFLSGSKQARTAAGLVAQAGLRLGTLGDYLGKEGLRLADFPELRVEDGHVEFERTPAMLIVRRELSKARHQYFTFLAEEGCSYLKDYLDERLRRGEELTGESPVIRPKYAVKTFIRTINVGDLIRKPIRQAGFPWRPYVLRSYFDTRLMLAESDALILRDYRQFFMGHKGDIESKYTTNKCRLPEEVLENMRAAYTRSQTFLQTSKPEVSSEEQIKRELKKQFMIIAGFTEEEVDNMDLEAMTSEEVQAKVKERLLGVMVNNGSRQKVIPAGEVEDFITQGWEYVNSLPDDKAIMKLPG